MSELLLIAGPDVGDADDSCYYFIDFPGLLIDAFVSKSDDLSTMGIVGVD